MISLDSKLGAQDDHDDDLASRFSGCQGLLWEAWAQGLNEGSLRGMLFKLSLNLESLENGLAQWRLSREMAFSRSSHEIFNYKDFSKPLDLLHPIQVQNEVRATTKGRGWSGFNELNILA